MRYLRLFFLCSLLVMAARGQGLAQGFEARFAGQQTVDGENGLAVTFSSALDSTQDFSPYFQLEQDNGQKVEGAWILAEDPQVVYFTHVEPDTRYRIRVDQGLRSKSGQILAAPVVYEVTTRPAEPMIVFGSKGFLLPSKLVRGLPVDTLNIKQADIDFFRIKPEKLAEFKKNFGSKNYIYYYQSGDLAKVADLVYSGRWDLDIKKDLRTRVNIPITHIQELKPAGIYFAVLQGSGIYEYGYNSTWFTISDLGVHARVYAQSMDFFVQSLETSRPVKNARVEGFDRKGNSLFEKQTDTHGRAAVPGNTEKLSLVSVSRGSQVTLMPMDVPGLDLSEFKTGPALFRPVDLFVYGPRDIYRPGEIVYLDGILRSHDGNMTPGLPIQARVIQPDGRMIREFTWKAGPQNHYSGEVQLPANALTGKWRVEFRHGTGELEPYPFVVAEFLPEQMKLVIDEDEKIQDKKQDLEIRLQGDFLYGAPASGLRANALVHVKPARELFKDQWPGFEFGGIKGLINTSFTSDDIRLDDDGKGVIPVERQWEKVISPHWVTANVSLYGSGGRPVVRNTSWQVWPANTLVGIRNISSAEEDPHQVANDSVAAFEVILADRRGTLLGAKGLRATIIREHREYYWEFKNGEWHWGSTSQFYPMDRFSLDISKAGKARVNVPVKWGGYRLEIENPETGLTSAFTFWAGWRPDSGREMNRPDRVDLFLDRPAYLAGEKAMVTVKAPKGGKGFLFVEADKNLLTLPITIPPQGGAFEIPIDPGWQRHDLYLSALVIRPGQAKTSDLPKRAVGLIPLPLDREARKLGVSIQAPDKTEPNQRVQVTVDLTRADGKIPQKAWVTLAAVDVGILNLTKFKTPSPFDYFFQTRRYGAQLHDVYQKLIEAGKEGDARQRFGGDAPSLTRGGDRPATDVQIVAMRKLALNADDQGRAVFNLDLPDFDGSLRLMAVAHTVHEFGAADREMVLASPLVVQATMPRFLACRDRGELLLDFHNLTDRPQSLTLETEVFGPISFQGERVSSLELAPNAKTAVRLNMTAGTRPGRAQMTCRIKGLNVNGESREMEKKWFLETRSAYPPLTRIWKTQIPPNGVFELASADVHALVPETVNVRAGLGTEPVINLADHVSQLFAYPYGCLEQTVSGLFPHVFLTESDFSALGLKTHSKEETETKIRLGIQRLLEKQKSSGGFGLWDGKSPESAWLTAYAAHFFTAANDAGFEIPRSGVKKAMDRLVQYVRRPNMIPYPGHVNRRAYRAAVRAYAAFVLARVQSLGLGDARSVFAYVDKYGSNCLGLVQAGVALSLAGDRHTAVKAFDLAIKTQRDPETYLGDYGSNVRDFSAAYYYLSTYFPEYRYRALFLHELDAALSDREWLSTQERNALVMAGAARRSLDGKPWAADLMVGASKDQLSGTRPGQAVFTRGLAAKGFKIKNSGKTDLYLNLVLAGYPNTMPAPQSLGVSVSRRFLDPKGKPVQVSKVKSGDRIIVELKIKSKKHMPHGLVVDMVPAGVELEDPNLSGAFLINDVVVDKKSIGDWQSAYEVSHTEFRDDRFVAALDIRARMTCRVFYPIRVVSPGRFRVPPPLVEDMYRPGIRGVGKTIPIMEVTGP